MQYRDILFPFIIHPQFPLKRTIFLKALCVILLRNYLNIFSYNIYIFAFLSIEKNPIFQKKSYFLFCIESSPPFSRHIKSKKYTAKS